MELFADVFNGVVENVIVGEKDQPIQLLLPKGHTAILVNESSGFPIIGLRWNEKLEKFEQGQPFASWTWDESLFEWLPPVPKPNKGLFYWNEVDLEWASVPDLISKE